MADQNVQGCAKSTISKFTYDRKIGAVIDYEKDIKPTGNLGRSMADKNLTLIGVC